MLDVEVFSQPQIGDLMEQNFVPVKINADMSPALAAAFNIDRVPSEVVLTPQGNVVTKLACPPTPDAYGSQLVNLAQQYRLQAAAGKTPAQPPVQAAYAGLQVGQYNNAPIATTPTATTPPPAAVTNEAPAVAQTSGPQVTHNIYATAKPNPQTSQPPLNAATPDRYAQQQATMAPPAAQPPTGMQSAPTQAALPAEQHAMQSQATANLAASAAPAAQPVGPPKLPAGAPPLAFEGYCPVTLKHVRKWVMGDPKYGAIHRGRTYLFTGEAQRQQFLTNPDAFSPVFSGIDPVKMLDENLTVEGSRKFGYEYRGAFYLFSSQESMARFASQPDRYAAGVRQAMTRMDATGSETMRR